MSPLPARAILSRCVWQGIDEEPSWAAYIRSAPLPRPMSDAEAACSASQPVPQVHAYRSTPQPAPQSQGHSTSASASAIPRNASSVRGRIWALAQEPQGSRHLQAIQEVASPAELVAFAREFCGHISEAAKCRHANFVVQKCIVSHAPDASAIIVRELLSQGRQATMQMAKHRYGCRIIQRLLEFCDDAAVNELSDIMLRDAESLSAHPYGNYTMQHILVHGSASNRTRLVKLLKDKATTLASNFHASAVIGEALRQANEEDAKELALVLHSEPGLISQMARTKHGHTAARAARHLLSSCTKEEDEVKSVADEDKSTADEDDDPSRVVSTYSTWTSRSTAEISEASPRGKFRGVARAVTH